MTDCLARFESGRREAVEKIQHAADVSLVWFEHIRRFWPMHPTRFAFGVMTRSKAIGYDDLTLRAPDFIQEVDTLFARESAENEVLSRPPMFQPFRLRGMRLANRVVVSPMCQYSARDGMPTDWHLVHYGARATGGAGLVYTEMTCPSADARITPGCAGPVDRRAGRRPGSGSSTSPTPTERQKSASSSGMPVARAARG